MAEEQKPKSRLEIAHVLFMDIVGYSTLLTDEQSEALQELNQIVRSTEAAREADAEGKLTILPTGDGMALVFSGSVEEPAECALEISQALRAQPSLPVRMGIHSGPVHHVKDANGRENIAGIGINIAQRVMDCGDAGHILVSKRVADDLAQHRRWQPYLHELGDVEVKHGTVVSLVNLYAETIGNPAPPERFGGKARGLFRPSTGRSRKGLSPVLRAIFIIIGVIIGLTFILGIVSIIFTPAIMRSIEKNRAAPSSPGIPSPPGPPSLGDDIQNIISQKVREKLQEKLPAKKNAPAVPSPPQQPSSPQPSSSVPEKSIAVLPFENLSQDPANAYFADGIQEEILTRLSKVADLKVISRTSTQRYKSGSLNVPEIAKQLAVANVLEGSIQKASDQVRVSIQLIHAESDSHLWADSFDRKLTDIFAVETEIATKVAEILQAKLSGAEHTAMAARPTGNMEAHELYLRARYLVAKRTQEDAVKAIELYHQAITSDPNYALAFAGLAEAQALITGYGQVNPDEILPQARSAANRALVINPQLPEAHMALGLIALAQLNVAEGERELEQAITLDPNNADAHSTMAQPLVATGKFDAAIEQAKRALELDPLSLVALLRLGGCYRIAGRLAEASEVFRKLIELNPAFAQAQDQLGLTMQLSGNLDGAIAQFQRSFEASGGNFHAMTFLAQAYALKGDRDKALETLERAKELQHKAGAEWAAGYAFVALALGDKEQAIDWLERSYRRKESFALLLYIKVEPLLKQLHGNPRFEKLANAIVPLDVK